MQTIQFELQNEEQTVLLGKCLAEVLVPICKTLKRAVCVTLEGDLGAGKTTLSRGFILSLGFTGIVRSPTYTLVEPYDFADFSVFHFDLYRLEDPEELEYMGIRDYFSKTAVCLFEWPDKAAGLLPESDVQVCLSYDSNKRNVMLKSHLADTNIFEHINNVFNLN